MPSHSRSAALATLALGLFAPLGSAQQVSWFLGPPGGLGEVAAFDQATGLRLGSTPALTNVALLPIDFVGRTSLNDLLPSAPRLRADVPGATRIALSNGNGSLYRFRRDGAGLSVFGYLWIDASGTPRAVLERPGPGGLDPWLAKVAIAPDGLAFLAATSAGELLEADLALGLVHARGVASGVQPNGLALLADWGVVTTASGLLRFERTSGASVAAVPFPAGTPPFVGNGVVASADGHMVAAIAGPSAASAHVWSLGRTGSATQISETAIELPGPGFLPEQASGPYIALSPAASACLWRSQPTSALVSTEAWVRRTQLAAPPAVQVTADPLFVDTLDSTGEFGFFNELTALVMVGEADGAGGIEGADVYRVDLDPGTGATTVSNLSATSGVLVPPFVKGELDSASGVHRIGASGLLIHLDLSSDEGELGVVRLDQPGFTVLRDGVSVVEARESAGADIALVVRDPLGASQLLSVPTTLAGVTLHASLPAGFSIGALSTGPGGWAGVLLDVPGGRWIGRVHLPTSTPEVLLEIALPLGSTLGFTPSRVAFSLDFSPQRSLGVTWGPTGAIGLYPTGGLSGHFLP